MGATRAIAVMAALAALALGGPPARAGGMDDLPGPSSGGGSSGDLARALTNMPSAREQTIGTRMAARLLGAVPPVRDDAVQGYVNRVGRWVASVSERPDLDWTFAVLDTPAINSFAAPGGYVFITRGLFLLLENEAELAAVLGHEIAHVTEKHHLEALAHARRVGIAADILARTGSGDIGRAELHRLADRAARLFVLGLDKQDEYDADRIGGALAARAGYDPWMLTHTLTTLSALEPTSSAMSLHSGTHPPPRARRDTLVNALDIMMDGAAPGEQPLDRFRAMRQRLAGR